MKKHLKKTLALLLCLLMALSLFAACDKSGKEPEDDADVNKSFDVALLINGTLGDKSFHDSANNGMQMCRDELGIDPKVIEVTYDETKWEPALLDLCEEGHDVIICGTWQMQEILSRVANDFPDQKFIIYDTTMDYTDGAYPNVHSIQYKQNDGSFLAGVLAALMSESKSIGFVGGMDNTVIYDFLVGYIQGAKEADPDVKVASAFVGDFQNTGRAKELALSQFNMGTDIIFSCASTAGDGTMQAGKEVGKMVIGVDSDQAMLYKETDEALANLIPSSVLKRVDVSLYRAIDKAMKGELEYGVCDNVGIPENCIGLADNEIYQSIVPQDVRDKVKEYEEKIAAGDIEVLSAFNMENEELLDYVNDAK